MPPRRAAATRASAASATEKATTTKTKTKTTTSTTTTTKTAAATKKTTVASKAAPKKAAAAKPKKDAASKAAAAPKKAAPKKPAASARKKAAKQPEESDKENASEPPKVNGTKRRRDEEGDEEQVDKDVAAEDGQPDGERAPKRAKTDEAAPEPAKKRKTAAPRPAPKRAARELKVINEPPTQVMDIFVFGEGTAGELGLGSVRVDGKKPIDVKRPRFNHNLKGVVQIACGGMHVAALTQDNKILTWGVNDQGALGRDTTWDGGLRDVDDDESDDDSEDTGMNPKESTPAEIDTSAIPEGTKWVQVVASDSATFALTATGQVYGWGTFRVSEEAAVSPGRFPRR